MIKIPDNIFTRLDIQNLHGCSERAAQRIIKSWLNNGSVEVSHKISKRTYYTKAEKSYSGYQPSFIDHYIPNKSYFLSKVERDALSKIAAMDSKIDLETFSIKLYERLLVDLSWASSKLEGNTYSLLETEKLILKNEQIEGKDAIETQMILNHKEAIKFITLNRKELRASSTTMRSIHALLAENLLSNRQAIGALRKIPVGITGTDYIPIDTPQLIEEEFNVFIDKASHILDPFEQSLFILIFIPYIQPFEDINKRTSRVACNIPLLQKNILPISFKNIESGEYVAALKDVYEKNSVIKLKELFIKAVQFSSRDYKKIVPTLKVPSQALITYRSFIKETVYECVAHLKPLSKARINSVDEKARDEILKHIQEELQSLHEGQLVRFGLSPSQFKKWQERGSK